MLDRIARSKSRSGSLFAAFLGCSLALSCNKDAGVASVLLVAMVDVEPPSGDVVVGQALQLTAVPKTEGGIILPARDVTWASTNNSTATVSPEGLLTALSVGGPVRVRATVSGVTGETMITVVPVPVDRVTVTPSLNSILVGQAAQLTATAYDTSGAVLTGRTFFWASDASSIAAITTTGLVLGMGQGGPVSITASAEGKTGSASVSVSRRPAGRLGFGQQPGQAITGIALTPAVQVLVQDDLLGTVTDATNAVTIALAGNSAGATLSGTLTVAAVRGVATFAGLVLDRAGTGYTLTASSLGLIGAVSNPFTVVAGAPNRLALTTSPSATAQNGVAFATQPVVQIRDGSDNPVNQSGVIVTASIASGNGTLGGTLAVPTNASGTAVFSNLSLAGPVGAFTIAFSAPGIVPVTSGAINLSAGAPAALAIVTQPAATARSGVALARQPTVRLVDSRGNVVPQSGVVITAAIVSGPAGGTLTGSAVASTDNNGVATFTGLTLTGPAGSYLLGFGGSGLPGVSSTPIALAAGAGAGLSLTTQPSSFAANATVFAQQPVVQLRDAAGNPVTQANVVVTASIQTGNALLVGGTTITTDASGVAAFANLAITGPTGPRTLLFASTGYVPVVSGTVTVSPGPASQVVMVVQPSGSAQSGVVFPQQPVVRLLDVSDNPVSQAGTAITATLASGPAGGALGGTTAATTDANGVAGYSSLSVTGPPGAYTLAFGATGLAAAAANPVALGAGAATRLALTTQPSSTAVNTVVFAQQPVAQLVDGSGTPVAQAGVAVTVAISGTGGTLGGVATVNTNGSGRAAFGGLSITGKAGGYGLAFSAPNLTGLSSGTIALAAGPAAQLVISQQPPSTAQSGVAFPQQPAVQLQDVSGNPVGQSGITITATLASGPPGGSLGGTTTATTAANGAAAYSSLGVTGPPGAYTITFSGPSLPGVTSTPVTVAGVAAARLAVVTQPPATAVNASVFAPPPVIQLLDGAGAPLGQAGVGVTVSLSGSGGTLGGVTTVATDGAGRAAFSGLSITGTTGQYALAFSASGLAGVSSTPMTLTAGPAAQLTITTPPSGSAQSGVAFTQQPELQLRDASNNPVSQSGVAVTATLGSGGGTLGGTVTATTSPAGAATFSNLSITGTTGPRTLSFTSGTLTGATSGTIDVNSPGATRLGITTQPPGTAASGSTLAPAPVAQLQNAAGGAVAQAGVTITVALASGSGTLGGSLSANTDATGIATFTGLSIAGLIGNYTLGFASAGITGALSNTIALTAGPATGLTIAIQPSASAEDGKKFNRQPIIQIRDAAGNPVAVGGAFVTATINSGPGTIRGTTTILTNSAGTASYSDLKINGEGTFTLRFTSPGLTQVISITIVVD